MLGIVGGLYTFETFLVNQEDSSQSQQSDRLSAVAEQLTSEHPAVRAGAVRSLYQVAWYEAVPRSDHLTYYPGSHLLNRYWYRRIEQPFHDQAWTLFREYAQQPRLGSAGDSDGPNVVSSALLAVGIEWQSRVKQQRMRLPSRLGGSLLFGAALPNARGDQIESPNVSFGAIDLRGATLPKADFAGCGMPGAQLADAVLTGAQLTEIYLGEADLTGADLSFVTAPRAILRKATLSNVVFRQSNLSETDFSGATLNGALFSHTALDGATFDRASLNKTTFSQTDVSKVSFVEADVSGADFTDAIGFTETTLALARHRDNAVVPQHTAPTQVGEVDIK